MRRGVLQVDWAVMAARDHMPIQNHHCPNRDLPLGEPARRLAQCQAHELQIFRSIARRSVRLPHGIIVTRLQAALNTRRIHSLLGR